MGRPDDVAEFHADGQLKTVTRNNITTTPPFAANLGYDDANQPLTEGYTSGTLAGLTMGRTYNNYLKMDSVAATNGTTRIHGATYGYTDASGRLTTVQDSVDTAYAATYSYVPNSALVDTLTMKYNTSARLTTRRQYDRLNRLQSIQSTPAGATLPASYGYRNNAANQRTRTTLADGSFWSYTYDALGQVTSGKRTWGDGTPACPVRCDEFSLRLRAAFAS